jgi:hypothetical protein
MTLSMNCRSKQLQWERARRSDMRNVSQMVLKSSQIRAKYFKCGTSYAGHFAINVIVTFDVQTLRSLPASYPLHSTGDITAHRLRSIDIIDEDDVTAVVDQITIYAVVCALCNRFRYDFSECRLSEHQSGNYDDDTNTRTLCTTHSVYN